MSGKRSNRVFRSNDEEVYPKASASQPAVIA